MSDIAIHIEGLAKKYQIGRLKKKKTLRETLASTAVKPVRAVQSLVHRNGHHRTSDETLWALRDISFEVKHGEVTGIIGRNGAGKSTLLKILSRITNPTEGYADIYGRVGSLLEVGTGFHPELTGRENIYLNGAILGMKRAEIKRKFDEIVAFSEVEQFIDTPVKHYSSGMYVRLAFAVAAHLEPEILLVDEVLAVGDAHFQKKCLGKMGEVAKEGRTVLFVSHNMGAVKSLCSSAIMLNGGRLAFQGNTQEAINNYLLKHQVNVNDLSQVSNRQGRGPIRFRNVEVLDHAGLRSDMVQSGEQISIELHYDGANPKYPKANVVFRIYFYTALGERLFMCSTRFANRKPNDYGELARLPTSGRIRCSIPKLPLMPGQYSLEFMCNADGRIVSDYIPNAMTLTVVEGDFFGGGRLPAANDGPLLVENSWELVG